MADEKKKRRRKKRGLLWWLKKAEALRVGHFVYSSGRHGSDYVAKDALYTLPRGVSRAGEVMAGLINVHDDKVDFIIAPAVAGAILGQAVARHLGPLAKRPILSLYADKVGADAFELKRGYGAHVKGKRGWVVEDVMTTGGTAQKIAGLVRANGGEVAGIVVLWNRGGVAPETLGVTELLSAIKKKFPSYDPAECPLCKSNVPINTDFGHGQTFLDAQSKKPG